MAGQERISTRRTLIIRGAAVAGAAVALRAAAALAADAPASKPSSSAPPDVSPTEDLMREHGVLRRVLLIHDEVGRQLSALTPVPPQTLAGTTGVIRKFIQDYHEKLEEDFIFPLFTPAAKSADAAKLADLVKTLKAQHDAGRKLVDQIARLAKEDAIKEKDSRLRLVDALRLFARMYRPHAAREDTVLFPALHSVMTAAQFDQMGDKFEDKEQDLFGKGGFEKIVADVDAMEKALGIEDISKFTPTGS
ncbi:MAG: hemerythrin domain-containing protein [Phycisphaerae bacterium]